jgi:hypothetical protein
VGRRFPLAGTYSDNHVAGAIQLIALKSTQSSHGRYSGSSLGVWGLSSTHKKLGSVYKGRCRVVQRAPPLARVRWCCLVYLSRLRACRTFFRLRTMGRCRWGNHSKRGSMSRVCINSAVSKVQQRKQACNRNSTRGSWKIKRLSIGGDPGGYLQQFLSPRSRAISRSECDKHQSGACQSGSEFLE